MKKIALLMVFMMIFTFSYSFSDSDDGWDEEMKGRNEAAEEKEEDLDDLEEEIESLEDIIDYLEDVLEDLEDSEADDDDDMNEDNDDDDMEDALVNIENLSVEEIKTLLADKQTQLEALEEEFKAKKLVFDELLDFRKSELETLKDQLEKAKDELEEELEALEEEIEDLREAGEDTSALEAQYQEKLEAFNDKKAEMKASILERRSLVIKKYRARELKKIEEAKKRLEELSTMEETLKVLPVESVLSKGIDFKFDTPPVIKGDRTVVPIRAITEGFGADVSWDGETRTVTIQKGDIEISMPIDSFEVKVNGETVELDVQSEIMNSRTYVPLRFIVETFGLEINWHSETETIEIEQ